MSELKTLRILLQNTTTRALI